MAKTGYNSYRGRSSGRRRLMITLLVLVLVGACTVLFLQQYITYTDDGSMRLDLPFLQESDHTEDSQPPQQDSQVNLVVDQAQPEEPQPSPAQLYGEHRLMELKSLPADEAALRSALAEQGANGFVYTVRDNTGRVFYDSSASIRSAAVGAAGSSAAISHLCQAEDIISVAKFNCFHDSYYAWTHMKDAGICQTTGHIWYDNISYHWLDPEKEDARKYVIGLALECAQLGFDELLLEDACYPTAGKLEKIDYSGNTMEKSAALQLFLTELQQALADYDMKITLLLDESLFSLQPDTNYIADSGLEIETVLPLVDAVFTPASDPIAAQAALSSAIGENTVPALVPMVETPDDDLSNWLIFAN